MKFTSLLRRGLCFLLALSVVFSMGAGAFAEETTETPSANTDSYGSTKTLYTGSNQGDDKFSLVLDAYQNGSIDVTKTDVPLDVTIVLDRSQSMSQPASTVNADQHNVYKGFTSVYPGAILTVSGTNGNATSFVHSDIVVSEAMQTQIDALNEFLKTLDTTKYEGYYRATNILKRNSPYFVNNHIGFAANGYASWEPMRYNTSTQKWEVRVTNGVWGEDFPGGINTIKFTGDITNRQYEWMTMEEAYKEYCARCRRQIYCTTKYPNGNHDMDDYYDFVIATPRLTKAVDATEAFIQSIYESSQTLPAGQSHRVSILSFGTGAFYEGGRYGYNGYDRTLDAYVKYEGNLAVDLGVSKTITTLDSQANLDSLFTVLESHYTYTNTRTDWALDAIESEAGFLPDNNDGSRKQVVVLITDGAPTDGDDMKSHIAHSALASAKILKSEGVEIYTIGFMPNLNQEEDPKDFNHDNPGNPSNANSFLSAVSSYYPDAESVFINGIDEVLFIDNKLTTTDTSDDTEVWTHYPEDFTNTAINRARYTQQTGPDSTRVLPGYGTKTDKANPFYMADDGTGTKLHTIFQEMQSYIIETAITPYFEKADSLYLFDEITREFKLDTTAGGIKVYAEAYTGNNTFGTRTKLATHSFTEPKEGAPVTLTGKGYTITLTKTGELTQAKLDWTDAEYAFLREKDYNAGGEYSATYPKGYKIVLELPLVVNRDNTLGGNNINTNTSVSGLYAYSEDSSNTGAGDLIIEYPIPNANVKPNVDPVVYDYFMDLADYVANYQNATPGSAEAQAIYEAMYQSLAELQKYLENHKNDYVDISVELLNALGQLLDGMHADAGKTAYTPDATAEGATFDFLVDQVLSFVVTLTPTTNSNDSCADANNGKGVTPYASQVDQLAPNYYGPKYVVVDFDETVKTPLDKEGGLSPKVTGTNGAIDGTSICYNFRNNYASGNKSYLEKDYTTVKYQVTAINAPKAQKGNTTVDRNFYVIPANVMTYDDTFMAFDSNGWETIGTYTEGEQSHDNAVIHGYDALYNGTYSKDYYHNALKAVTVSKTKGVAQATFTITGTGFDIFAQTGPNSGALAVEVSTDEGNKNDVRSYLVDTYLKEATLNQIPVVRCDDLPYGTYYIRITAFYDSIFDHNYVSQWKKGATLTEEALRERYGIPADADFTFIPSQSGYDRAATRSIDAAANGQYNVYIDGFRVYNTINNVTSNPVANYGYSQAGEGVANILNINDALVDATNANAWSGNTASGVLYTSAGAFSVQQGDTSTGIILGMEGALYTKQSGSKFYVFKDAALTVNVQYKGANVYYRTTTVTSPNGREYTGFNYYYDGGSASKPMLTTQIKEAFGGEMPLYYNAKYSQYGPEKEVYLQGTNGVAFKVGTGATKVMISLKSNNGSTATLKIYDPKSTASDKFVTLASTTSRVEMYYDITKYITSDGYIYLKNAKGITAVCNIKTIGTAARGITVDRDLMAWVQSIDNELPVDESAEIKHSLNLASDISLNYLVSKATLADYDRSYLEVTFKGETFCLEPEVKGEYGYFVVDGITAVDMTEELTATLHMFLGEEEYVSETDVYSVSEYAYAQLNKEGISEELKAVCANLLRYGAQAQTYKGSENILADAAMTDAQKAYVTDINAVSAVSVAKALGDVDNGIAWAGKSLILDSKVAVKAVFALKDYAGNMEALNLRVSYTNAKGEEVALIVEDIEVYNAALGYYAFTVDTLLASEMRSELTMALYEGDVQVSETQIYSVESYCASRTGALAELGKTLLAYSDAAKAYFG